LWKGVRPGVDPDDAEGQGRQRQDQGAADMACPEQIEHPPIVAEALLDDAMVNPCRSDADRARPVDGPVQLAIGKLLAARPERRGPLGLGQFHDLLPARMIEYLQREIDAPAAALSELGAERDAPAF